MGQKQGSFDSATFFENYQELVSRYGLTEDESTLQFLDEVYGHFHQAYPGDVVTKTEFIRDNVQLKGGNEGFWDGVFTLLDADNSNCIDFRELLTLLLLSRSTSPRNTMEFVFHLLDTDRSGALERDEIGAFLRMIRHKYGGVLVDVFPPRQEVSGQSIVVPVAETIEDVTEEELLTRAMAEIDADSDGIVTLEEFLAFSLHHPTLIDAVVDTFDQRKVMLKEGAGHMPPGEDTEHFWKAFDEREFDFYETVLPTLTGPERAFFPTYAGRDRTVSEHGRIDHFLKIENLILGFSEPVVLKLSWTLKNFQAKKSRNVVKQFLSPGKFRVSKFSRDTENVICRFLLDGRTYAFDVAEHIIETFGEMIKFFNRLGRGLNYTHNLDSVTVICAYDRMDHGRVRVKLEDFEGVEVRTSDVPRSRSFNKVLSQKLKKFSELFTRVCDTYQ